MSTWGEAVFAWSEARVIPREGLGLDLIRVAGLKGKSLVSRLRGLALLPLSAFDAWRVISRRRPSVVVGVGGYSSGPVVMAAWMLGVPTAVQEQNALPGATNKVLGKFVKAVFLAFDEATGKVKWTFETGGDVYGSPAVAQVPGTPPTVYIGSEDGTFFALNARTGKLEWKYDVGGPVPGTATVIGHTVYVSSFKTRKTIGIDVRTHKKDFEIDQAGYTPMISDGRRLILVGYYTVIGLEPSKP